MLSGAYWRIAGPGSVASSSAGSAAKSSGNQGGRSLAGTEVLLLAEVDVRRAVDPLDPLDRVAAPCDHLVELGLVLQPRPASGKDRLQLQAHPASRGVHDDVDLAGPGGPGRV